MGHYQSISGRGCTALQLSHSEGRTRVHRESLVASSFASEEPENQARLPKHHFVRVDYKDIVNDVVVARCRLDREA